MRVASILCESSASFLYKWVENIKIEEKKKYTYIHYKYSWF